MRRHAAAVDEHKRAAGAKAAKIDGGIVAARALAGGLLLGEEGRIGDRDRVEEIGGRGDAAEIHILLIDDGDGQRGLDIGAADIGAGDGKGLHLNGLGRRRGRRRRRGLRAKRWRERRQKKPGNDNRTPAEWTRRAGDSHDKRS